MPVIKNIQEILKVENPLNTEFVVMQDVEYQHQTV